MEYVPPLLLPVPCLNALILSGRTSTLNNPLGLRQSRRSDDRVHAKWVFDFARSTMYSERNRNRLGVFGWGQSKWGGAMLESAPVSWSAGARHGEHPEPAAQ